MLPESINSARARQRSTAAGCGNLQQRLRAAAAATTASAAQKRGCYVQRPALERDKQQGCERLKIGHNSGLWAVQRQATVSAVLRVWRHSCKQWAGIGQRAIDTGQAICTCRPTSGSRWATKCNRDRRRGRRSNGLPTLLRAAVTAADRGHPAGCTASRLRYATLPNCMLAKHTDTRGRQIPMPGARRAWRGGDVWQKVASKHLPRKSMMRCTCLSAGRMHGSQYDALSLH